MDRNKYHQQEYNMLMLKKHTPQIYIFNYSQSYQVCNVRRMYDVYFGSSRGEYIGPSNQPTTTNGAVERAVEELKFNTKTRAWTLSRCYKIPRPGRQ